MKTTRNKIILFECNDLQDTAQQIFLKMSAFGARQQMSDALKSQMLDDLKALKFTTEPKLIFSYFGKESIRLKEDTIYADNVAIKCRGFSQVDFRQVNGVYVYFINAGSVSFENNSMREQFFADLWGNAIVDAMRHRCDTLFGKEGFLSEEFGPGFYGMDLREMFQFVSLADASLIGISIKHSGMLVPTKSCALLRFDVTEDYRPLNTACQDCIGSKQNCSLCHYRR